MGLHPVLAGAMVHTDDHEYRTRTARWNRPDSFRARYLGSSGRFLAVSDDGTVLKKSASSTYNDRVVEEGGADGSPRWILYYVCGVQEERDRQQQLCRGDTVHIVLYSGKRATTGGDGARAGVVRGTFDCMQPVLERGSWGREFFTQHSRIELHAALGLDFEFHPLPRHAPVLAPPEDANVASPFWPGADATHLLLDTESAAPRWHATERATGEPAAHPIVQLAYARVRRDFAGWPLDSRELLLRYPDDVHTGYGSDSSVQKFSPEDTACALDAATAIRALLVELERVHESGGWVIAHNAVHDLRQIRATAEAVGVPTPELTLRVLDTMTAATALVGELGGREWPTLERLALAAGLEFDRTLAHSAGYDTGVLRDVLRTRGHLAHLCHAVRERRL